MIKLIDIITESETITVYHGTSSKYIHNILKVGLMPKPNKWYVKYSSRETRAQDLKALPKELYVTPNYDDAMDFAESAGGNPIVIKFQLLPSDQTEKEKQFAGEIIVLNNIKPSRLTVVYPTNFNISKYQDNIKSASFKTDKIRSINKLLKSLNISFKSGSKTTDRILIYVEGQFTYSVLLGDLKKTIENNTFDHIKQPHEKDEIKRFISQVDKSTLKQISNLI